MLYLYAHFTKKIASPSLYAKVNKFPKREASTAHAPAFHAFVSHARE